MPVTTRSRSHSQANLTHEKASSHDSNSSIPGTFDVEPLSYQEDTILPPPVDKHADMLAVELDKLTLDSNLDLSRHPAHESFNLPARHAFSNIAEFRRAVADTSDGARILHSLATMVAYDVSTTDKMAEQYVQWKNSARAETNRRLGMQKEMDQVQQELDESQGEYVAMQDERDRLREELESAQR